MKTLNNWFTRFYDRYRAPEINIWCIAGTLESGKIIKTSAVIAFDNSIIITENGSQYLLLAPDPEWLEWLKEQDCKEDHIQQVHLAVRKNKGFNYDSSSNS